MRVLTRGSSPNLFGLLLLAAALAGAGGAACGGGSGSAQSASCRAACTRCGSDLCLDCAATSARFRDEFEASIYACVMAGTDAACDTLWTRCTIQAEGQLTPRSIDTTYHDACLTKRSDCEAANMGFADDNCLLSPVLEQSRVAQAQQCLSQTCAAISACFRPLFN